MKIPYKIGDKTDMSIENSNILDRTKELFQKITEDSTYNTLDKIEIHDFILNCILSFSNYVEATNNHLFTIQSTSILRDGEVIDQSEFERRLLSANRMRREKHNKAIDSCNQLNRLCEKYNIEIICKVDTNNRSDVANFAAHFAMISHGYALQNNYSMDEVVNMMNQNSNIFNVPTIFEER